MIGETVYGLTPAGWAAIGAAQRGPCQCGHAYHSARCSRSCPCYDYDAAVERVTPSLPHAYYQGETAFELAARMGLAAGGRR